MLALLLAFAPPVEIAPPPHAPVSSVAIAAVKNGYQIRLNRATAEMFRDALVGTDEKEIAASLRKLAANLKRGANPDEQTAATLELIAFVVANQLSAFRKSLTENLGPGGAIITLTGFQTPMVKFAKPRPRLEKALEIVRDIMPLLPDDASEAIEAVRAVARTTPLLWKVEPRE